MAKMVYYSGRVQGVGFRATAALLARQHALKGWVRNLSDGRVQLFADGPEASVNAFLAALRNAMHGYIQREETYDHPADPQLQDFRITY